ncbi:MAG TPA: Vms1/Ankzf1 family peptidyl-tRNA hydrolase [Candidatus Sulfotelmatobacter sp.]|nr:Vms1/Ankzf1 family peptidyl-tRNA hydrolase [Candidatus Sulfotelmatobacter sp.]
MATRRPSFSIDAEIRKLASVADPHAAVVTLYLDARGRDQHQREAIRTFVRRALAEARREWRGPAAAGAGLEVDLSRIQRYVEELMARGAGGRPPGIALFACAGAGLFVDLRAPLPFQNQFGVGGAPLLAQLSLLEDEYEPALVALVDAESARIFQSALGGVLSELDLVSNVPGRHKQGGWAQARYQRHIRAHQDEHHKAVAAVLAEGLNGQGIRRLILGGPPLAQRNLRRFLPPEAEGRIIAEVDLPVRVAVVRVQEAVRGALQAWERRQEGEAVRELQDRAGNPGQAALGLVNTLAAVNRRAVHLLLISERFAAAGWACRGCGALQAAATLACPLCGGALATADLREAVVTAVVRAGGGIEWVAAQPALERLGGVGALLRTSRGLR